MVILMFGPPGCGKGTQAALIASRYRIPTISTGEIFRAELKAGTPLGKRASAIMAQGGLVGDDIVNEMVATRIQKPDCRRGFLLDGFPRTVAQAAFLDTLLNENGLPEPSVIHLDVPADVLVRRVSNRRHCPQCARVYNLLSQAPRMAGHCDADGSPLVKRADDDESVIQERLRAYDELTGPVIDHYRRANYHKLNGDRALEQIQRQIERLLAPVQRPVRTARMETVTVGAY